MQKFGGLVLALFCVLALCSCAKAGPEQPVEEEREEHAIGEVAAQEQAAPTMEERLAAQLRTMTIEEKIAQMMIIQYPSETMDDTLMHDIRDVKPGGFLLTSENLGTYEQTKELVEALQSNSEIPMFISVDQEGGVVQRFSELSGSVPTEIPSMLSVGRTGETQLAYDIGKVIAEELRTVGINLDFAPVMDILPQNGESFIGTRSFGSDAAMVSAMAMAFAKGLEEHGVLSVYKHFPGHGDTTTDSHRNLPVMDKTKEELLENELIPFQKAIESGADMIMVGHIALPKVVGDDTPASLSGTIITDLLKTELGYEGLVITDALSMRALTNQYSHEEICIKAVEAGVDLLLLPNDCERAVELIKETFSEERIDQSVAKILRLKYTQLEKYSLLDSTYLGSDEHRAVVARVYE